MTYSPSVSSRLKWRSASSFADAPDHLVVTDGFGRCRRSSPRHRHAEGQADFQRLRGSVRGEDADVRVDARMSSMKMKSMVAELVKIAAILLFGLRPMGGSGIGSLIPAAYMPLFFIVAGYLLGSLPFAIIVTRLFGMADPRSYGSAIRARPTCCARATSSPRSSRCSAMRSKAGWPCGWRSISVRRAPKPSPRRPSPPSASCPARPRLPDLHRLPRAAGRRHPRPACSSVSAARWRWSASASGWPSPSSPGYSSLAAICAALAAPLFALWLLDMPQAVALAGMSVLVIWRHQQNIRNPLAGTEGRIGKKKAA